MTNPTPPPTAPGALQPEWKQLVSRAEDEERAERDVAASGTAHRAWGRSGFRVASVLFLLLAGVLVTLQLRWSPPAPTPADLDHGRRALLALIDSSLADHMRVHGEYPEKLEEVLPLQVEVTYRRIEGGYELAVRLSDGTVLTGMKP